MNRKRPVSAFTLAEETVDAMDILAEEMGLKPSRIIDHLVSEEMQRRGYTLERNTMSFGIEVICRGQVLPIYTHNGEFFIAAEKGQDYDIRLNNQTNRRRLFVLSVDGVNTIDGETAGYGGKGWVLAPYESTVIQGWLRNNQEAAKFKFTDDEKSYAAQTGRAKNVGIIGAAVFDEKAPTINFSNPVLSRRVKGWSPTRRSVRYTVDTTIDTTDVYRGVDDAPISVYSCVMDNSGGGGTSSCSVTPPATMDFMESDVGTAYGRVTEMRTTTTTFERISDSPAEVLQIRYASLDMLQKWGVPVVVRPSAFPAESMGVPPPPGWRP